MAAAFVTLGFLLLAGALATGIYHAIVWGRIYAAGAWLPTLRDGAMLDELPGGWPSLTVIVPAHNEEDVIARLAIALLASDYPADRLRIVFALDRCEDGTRAALASAVGDTDRVEILDIEHCPDDWAGKTHALHIGATRSAHARGADLLLFLDADTMPEPACLTAAVKLFRHREVDLLSVLSTLTADRWYEKYVQPAAAFELVRQFPLEKVNDPARPRAFANGQFMLFDRAVYDRIGGHELVKGELLEDIAIARRITQPDIGARIGCLLANGLLHCEMYRTHDGFERGWKRIFTEAARRRPKRLRDHARVVVLTGVVMPAASLLCVLVGAGALAFDAPARLALSMIMIGALALAQLAITTALIYRRQHMPLRFVVTYPFAAYRVGRLLAAAARDLDAGVRTSWGGREYVREAR